MEEIIALTGEQASYYFSLAMKGNIRVKGKFIRDEKGQLRPVLVRTIFLPPEADNTAESKNHPWGLAVPEASPGGSSPMRRKSLWFKHFKDWTQRFIRLFTVL
ncbi:hypothetical protein [Desulforamulus ferrireducens]|uniref:hypothetical protein n=1 Tax=Desulforamulus ferrireducens TaxID=1833852 RepID=UPI0011EA5816|nr:hypothetical protein [Desulforamulus ferrireducens]